MAINSNFRLGAKISVQLDYSEMHNRPCVKQMHLKYFRTPLFWETEAKFVRFGNFPHTLTYRGYVENCRPQNIAPVTQNRGEGSAENNNFFTFFYLFFALVYPEKFFIDFLPQIFFLAPPQV